MTRAGIASSVALTLLGLTQVAEAHGGLYQGGVYQGGGGGGGGGGGSSEPAGGSSGPADPDPPPDDRFVGNAPVPVEFQLAAGLTQLDTASTVFTGTDSSFQASGAALGYRAPQAKQLEASLLFGHGSFYGGSTTSIAIAQRDAAAAPLATPVGGTLLRISGGLLVGDRLRLWPDERLRIETLIGAHYLTVGLGQDADQNPRQAHRLDFLLQPRIAIEHELSRNFGLGVALAADVFPKLGDDLSLGVYLAVHSSGFDRN